MRPDCDPRTGREERRQLTGSGAPSSRPGLADAVTSKIPYSQAGFPQGYQRQPDGPGSGRNGHGDGEVPYRYRREDVPCPGVDQRDLASVGVQDHGGGTGDGQDGGIGVEADRDRRAGPAGCGGQRPFGVTARAVGSVPTGIAGPARSVAVLIGVTVSEPLLATQAVRPFGVTATACGPVPTLIAFPAFRLVRFTGVTVAEA
jgi:hypothetical protein